MGNMICYCGHDCARCVTYLATIKNDDALRKQSQQFFEMGNGANNTVLTFNVDDVDAEYERLLSLRAEIVYEPKTHPWGAKSFQFKDPDGNILNFRSLPKGG